MPATPPAMTSLPPATRPAPARLRGAGTPGGDVDPVAALHAQALGILNLRSLVPVVLDLATPNFSKWRRLLLLVLGKYALADHVLCDAAFPAVPHWVRMDLHVLSWLYSSISSDLFEIVTTDTPSARATWLALEHQFLGNRETRIVLVDTEFRTLCQGSLSVTDYCRRMKTLADSLVELGEPISDRLLTINVLRGIGERFNHLRVYLRGQRPFPTFVEVRSALLLEELSTTSAAVSPSVLAASAPPPVAPVPTPATALATGSSSSSTSASNRRRRRGKTGGGADAPAATPTPGGASAPNAAPGGWPSFYNPWTGTIQMWPAILDDCSHHLWTFPLRLKSDTFPTIANFFSYVTTHFGASIKTMQCDNGREFDNSSTRAFFLSRGVTFRMSCPYTSQQNGRAERILHTSLFIYRRGTDTAYLLLYVDDIVLTASSPGFLRQLIVSLQQSFPMKDLGPLQHFLGIAVTRSSSGMLLSQRQYTLEILERAGMTNCKSCATPVDTQSKLPSSGDPVADSTFFRSLVGALQYLTFTRPDITYAVQQLLQELGHPLQRATLVYCDNVSAVYLSTNPVQHQRTKHIEIDLHFVRERVAAGAVRVLHVPTSSQFADIFTKGLPSTVFLEFRSSINCELVTMFKVAVQTGEVFPLEPEYMDLPALHEKVVFESLAQDSFNLWVKVANRLRPSPNTKIYEGLYQCGNLFSIGKIKKKAISWKRASDLAKGLDLLRRLVSLALQAPLPCAWTLESMSVPMEFNSERGVSVIVQRTYNVVANDINLMFRASATN
ncbi:hypothetical protein U9M48_021244 [Paspalum notatum var. saurae]|uniref:Integrase catalytic domain-containing protein n=1 Tax=Paspalum notatum var. saurae TaxID=547442 RepID=A0AAQ3TIA4_PASNO